MRNIILLSILLFFFYSCDNDEKMLTKNNIDNIKIEMVNNLERIKLKGSLPNNFSNENNDIIKFYKCTINDMLKILNKHYEPSTFYGKLNGVVNENGKYLVSKNDLDRTIDAAFLTELTKFVKEMYFKELENNDYDYLKTGISIENSILQCYNIDETTKKILYDFIYNISNFFTLISNSDLIKKETKITEKAFLKCVDKELGDVFSNPIKTINFLIQPPISFLWLSAGCVYDTWNA